MSPTASSPSVAAQMSRQPSGDTEDVARAVEDLVRARRARPGRSKRP